MQSDSYQPIVNEVFYALLGLTGDVIIEVEDSFVLNTRYDLLNEAIRFQIEALVRLGWCYKIFRNISDMQHIDWKFRTGIYEMALFDGISDVLSEYESDVGYLEENDRLYGNVTLSYMMQHLQKYMSIFPEINALLSDLIEKNIAGCQIINYLNDFSSGIPVVMTVVLRFLTGLRVVLVKQIYSWMLFGELDEDFFIAKNADNLESESASIAMSYKQLSASLTQSTMKGVSADKAIGFALVHQKVPSSHLTPLLASKILFAGKAVKLMSVDTNLNALNKSDSLNYLSGGDAKLLISEITNDTSPMTSWNLREYFESEMGKISSELYVIHTEPDNAITLLEELIDKIYGSVTDHLWSLLKNKLKFVHFFYAMRNVYLLGKGELFQCILDQVILRSENNDKERGEVLWIGLLQNVAKSLSIDEEGLVQLLRLKLKQKGTISLMFSRDSVNDEEVSLVGSVVFSNNKIILCPTTSSVQFASPVDSVANTTSKDFNLSSTPQTIDCYKGGVLFVDAKSISNGFTTSIDFNLSFNSVPTIDHSKEDVNMLLCSMSLSLSPSVRELEACLLSHQNPHSFGAVSIGVSFHAVKRHRMDALTYQCQVFFTGGNVHRVTVIDIDERFLFLGSSLNRDNFTLQVEYLPVNKSSSKYSYIMKVRVIPAHIDGDYKNWSLEIPIDLNKFLSGGNAFLGLFGLSAKSVSTAANAGVSMNVFALKWKSIDPNKYVTTSSYTSTKFPDTAKELELEVSNINRYLCLDAHLKLPVVYQIVYDGEMVGCYRKIFSFLMKIRLIASLMEKLLIDHPSFILDRVFCHMKHSMHFFINNLLYYLQVDVIDAQFTELEESLLSGTDFQSFIRQQKKCLSHIMRMSMLNNAAMLQSINKVLHCCVRFIAVCRLVERQNDPNRTQLFVPSEEYDDVRLSFFSEVKSLLLILRNVDSGGFLFRLDFNGYFSAQTF